MHIKIEVQFRGGVDYEHVESALDQLLITIDGHTVEVEVIQLLLDPAELLHLTLCLYGQISQLVAVACPCAGTVLHEEVTGLVTQTQPADGYQGQYFPAIRLGICHSFVELFFVDTEFRVSGRRLRLVAGQIDVGFYFFVSDGCFTIGGGDGPDDLIPIKAFRESEGRNLPRFGLQIGQDALLLAITHTRILGLHLDLRLRSEAPLREPLPLDWSFLLGGPVDEYEPGVALMSVHVDATIHDKIIKGKYTEGEGI
jgi:hypothetical protein